jgi:hypothetical protein
MPRAAVGLAAIGVVSLGVIGFRLISNTNADFVGGAGSPEAAVEQFALALGSEDVFAATSFIAPDEIDGFTDVLNSFLSVIDAGSGGLVDGTDFEVEIELTDVSASMQGDSAAIVSFEVSGSIAPGVTSGPLSVALPSSVTFRTEDLIDLYSGRGDEIDVVTVKLGDKWFVSPMLTMGHLFVENNDLPDGDYDIIGSKRQGGGADPEDAVDAMLKAIEDRDSEDFADSLGGGEGRFARVFSDAIDELLGEISPDVDYSIDARISPGEGGRVVLEDIEVSYSDSYSNGSVEVDGDCVAVVDQYGESDRECLLDELPLITDVDSSIEFRTVEEGGGRRVRLVPLITEIAARLIPAFDRQTYLYAVGLEWSDTATAVAVGSDTDFDLDDAWYAVFEFDALANQRYRVTTDRNLRLWYRGEDGSWENSWSGSLTPETDTKVRVVTSADADFGCDETLIPICFPEAGGSGTLRVRAVPVQTGEFPAILVGELGPGDEIMFVLDVVSAANIQISFNAGEFFSWNFVGTNWDYDGDVGYVLEPGQVSISVFNYGSERGAFELVSEQTRVGFEGSSRVVVDISGGGSSTRVYLPNGISNITAFPLDDQDIVLELQYFGCTADDGYDGDAERCRVSVSEPGWYEINVRGYGVSNDYGQVELVLS